MRTMRTLLKPGRAAARVGLAALLALGALLCWQAAAQALNPRPLCDVCRRYTDKSAARAIGFIEVGRHVRKLDACSLFCFVEMLEDQVNEPEVIYVADYATYDTEDHIPLKADQAWYLYDCDSGDEQRTNQPYTYAFASKELAREYQDELGGELLDWEELVEALRELTDEWEPAGSSYQYRSLHGNRHQDDDDDEDG